MIALVEGASRQKTPDEIALTILLAALTAIFLIVTVTLLPFSVYAGNQSTPPLIALLVPDPHYHRRPALCHWHRRDRPGCPGKRARQGVSRRGRREWIPYSTRQAP